MNLFGDWRSYILFKKVIFIYISLYVVRLVIAKNLKFNYDRFIETPGFYLKQIFKILRKFYTIQEKSVKADF